MRRATAVLALSISVCVLVLLSGCAAPGEPTARHPIIPARVTDLVARQSGSDTVLSFSLPARSTDQEPLAESPTIEIYRVALAPGSVPNPKTQWRLLYTIPSEQVGTYLKQDRIEFRDPLPPDELDRPSGDTLAYMVRTRTAKVRASDDSNVRTLRIYPPPGIPREVHTTVTESAIILTWSSAETSVPQGATSVGYRVYRVESEAGAGSPPQEYPQSKLNSTLALLGPSSTTEFRDSNFEFGNTYLYTVRSVAQFGEDSVESAGSAPSVVTPRDVFPPAAPARLESAVIPATPQSPAYVELSWAISSEADLAGYYVYRGERANAPGVRMNEELLPSPTFRDISVVPGGQYFYRVSAVDRAGNESPKSSAVQTVVP